MPKAMVHLSAGRMMMSDEEQTLCFMAGTHSIFTGESLQNSPNPGVDHDKQLFQTLNLKPVKSFKDAEDL